MKTIVTPELKKKLERIVDVLDSSENIDVVHILSFATALYCIDSPDPKKLANAIHNTVIACLEEIDKEVKG